MLGLRYKFVNFGAGNGPGSSAASCEVVACDGGEGFNYSSQFEKNFFTKMCSGSEVGSYSRLIDLVYHSILGLSVIKKKKQSLTSLPHSWTDYHRVDMLGLRYGNVLWYRGGLVFEAHRLLYHSA